MRRSLGSISTNEVLGMSAEEIRAEFGEDYAEGVAAIKSVMREVREKDGYKDWLLPIYTAWKLRWVKYLVWVAQTALIIFYPKTIWISGLVAGFVFALLANIHAGNVRRICRRVQNHFDSLDGVMLDMNALEFFYNNQIPKSL